MVALRLDNTASQWPWLLVSYIFRYIAPLQKSGLLQEGPIFMHYSGKKGVMDYILYAKQMHLQEEPLILVQAVVYVCIYKQLKCTVRY